MIGIKDCDLVDGDLGVFDPRFPGKNAKPWQKTSCAMDGRPVKTPLAHPPVEGMGMDVCQQHRYFVSIDDTDTRVRCEASEAKVWGLLKVGQAARGRLQNGCGFEVRRHDA